MEMKRFKRKSTRRIGGTDPWWQTGYTFPSTDYNSALDYAVDDTNGTVHLFSELEEVVVAGSDWVNAAEVPMPTETYIMVRPAYLHPCRGDKHLPTIAFRREGDSDDSDDDVQLLATVSPHRAISTTQCSMEVMLVR